MKFEFYTTFIINVYIFINVLVRPLEIGLSANSLKIRIPFQFTWQFNGPTAMWSLILLLVWQTLRDKIVLQL